MGTDKVAFAEERWGATGSHTVRMLDQKWRHRKSRNFSPYFFFPQFFSVLFFPYYFPVLFFPVLFFRILFFRAFFRTFFSHTFFFVLFSRTFEIERFKISVSCFSSTCRYITVHVPCGIAIQTSPVRLPLDGWGARMRDLKGPNINLFNLKEDSNVL